MDAVPRCVLIAEDPDFLTLATSSVRAALLQWGCFHFRTASKRGYRFSTTADDRASGDREGDLGCKPPAFIALESRKGIRGDYAD